MKFNTFQSAFSSQVKTSRVMHAPAIIPEASRTTQIGRRLLAGHVKWPDIYPRATDNVNDLSTAHSVNSETVSPRHGLLATTKSHPMTIANPARMATLVQKTHFLGASGLESPATGMSSSLSTTSLLPLLSPTRYRY